MATCSGWYYAPSLVSLFSPAFYTGQVNNSNIFFFASQFIIIVMVENSILDIRIVAVDGRIRVVVVDIIHVGIACSLLAHRQGRADCYYSSRRTTGSFLVGLVLVNLVLFWWTEGNIDQDDDE
jgi:uncharacterized membrane protein